MNGPDQQAERSATEALIVDAVRLRDVELEPTPEEIEAFLADARQHTQVFQGKVSETTEAAYVAMNRENARDQFASATQEKIDARRNLLLEELIRRHENTDD